MSDNRGSKLNVQEDTCYDVTPRINMICRYQQIYDGNVYKVSKNKHFKFSYRLERFPI